MWWTASIRSAAKSGKNTIVAKAFVREMLKKKKKF